MSIYQLMDDDSDLLGEPDITCAWCGCEVYDRDATPVNGRRLCSDTCAEEYLADIGDRSMEREDQ